MVSIENIKAKLKVSECKHLENLIEEKVVTANQFLQILSKSFGVNSKTDDVLVRIQFGEVITLLKWMHAVDLHNVTPTAHAEAIKRLMKDANHEASNEILCHIGLSSLFKYYQVLPLFGPPPDGIIKEFKQSIPVEIKSRIPEVFDVLDYFSKGFMSVWPCLKEVHISVQLNLKFFHKTLSRKDIDAEILHIKRSQASFNYENGSLHLRPTALHVKHKLIEYTITIYVKPSSLSKNITFDNIFVGTNWSDHFNFHGSTEGLKGGTDAHFGIHSEVRKNLAEIFFTDWINGSLKKKLPSEPRIIAIYSRHFSGDYFTSFFAENIKKYLSTKTDTCVVGFSSNFNERFDNTVVCNRILAGHKIKSKIEGLYVWPDLINSENPPSQTVNLIAYAPK
ncbi:MAG: hypothetical protein ACI8Q1_003846 [Parvicella sp.]|jgi:hypothetical protein